MTSSETENIMEGILLQQQVQKTELIAQTKTFRKKIIYSLTLDNSASMRSKKKEVLSAARTIFDKLEDQDRLEFALFGETFGKLHGPKQKKYVNWSTNKAKIECNKHSTALHDSICESIDQFPRNAKFRNYNKVMIVLTDGKDNASKKNTFQSMINKLKTISTEIPNCKFFLIGVELSENVKKPYRIISRIKNCHFLEADQISQIADAFKQISKLIFLKKTTTITTTTSSDASSTSTSTSIDVPTTSSHDDDIPLPNLKVDQVGQIGDFIKVEEQTSDSSTPSSIPTSSPSSSSISIVTVKTTVVKGPCSFFARGNCKYGSRCQYSHDANVASLIRNNNKNNKQDLPYVKSNPDICHFFADSMCAKGEKCPFLHLKTNSKKN